MVARRRGDRIAPAFAKADRATLATARALIEHYRASVGARRGAFLERVRAMEEDAGTSYKTVRGLAALLDRRCHFEMTTRVEPAKARRTVWALAAARGPVTSREARAAVLAEAARDLDATAADVEQAMEADADENLVLVAFDAPEPEALVRAYNVALAQTLLFDAVALDVEIHRNVRGVFQAVKREGLMHVVDALPDGGYVLHLDGPASALKQTRRYGSAMAKVIPSLRSAAPWRLRAIIQERARPGEPAPPERVFGIDSDSLPFPPRADGSGDGEAAAFDSRVEQRFAEAFIGLRSGWRVEREPALLAAGASVLIPDFGFAHGNGPPTVFLEIVGYWTPAYLKRKLEKVRALEPGVDLILAVDRALGCAPEVFDDVPASVVFYDGDVPLAPIAHALKARAAEHVAGEVARAVAAGLPEGDVVRLDAWAAAAGVSEVAAEAAAAQVDAAGRERVGSAFVAPRVLAAIDGELAEGMALDEAEARIAKHGLTDASSVLARLGWRAEWRGLMAGSATLKRA